MSSNLKNLIGENKLIKLAEDGTYLAKSSTSKYGMTWRIFREEDNNKLEVYSIQNSGDLTDQKVAACANVFLAHREKAFNNPSVTANPAIVISSNYLEKKTISCSDLNAREIWHLKKTGISFPIIFDFSKTYSEEQLREHLCNLDLASLDEIIKDPLNNDLFEKVLANLAKDQPEVIYALVFKLLLEMKKDGKQKDICLMLSKHISFDKSMPTLNFLIWKCIKHSEKLDPFITQDNILEEAMLYSGFSLPLLKLLLNEQFNQTEALGLAALMGNEEITQHLLHISPNYLKQVIRYVCQDFPLSQIDEKIDDFWRCQNKNAVLPTREKQADFFRSVCLPKQRNPIQLLQTLLAQDLSDDPIDGNPDLLRNLCTSPLLSSQEKIAMMEILFKRHEEVLLPGTSEGIQEVAKAKAQANSDCISHLNHILYGDSLLLAAIERGGDRDLLTYLIQKGASIHAVDWEGNSLLHIAVKQHNLSALKLLTELGLDRNQLNQKKLTPFDLAINSRQLDFFKGAFTETVTYLLDNDFSLQNDQIRENLFIYLIKNKESSLAAQFCRKYLQKIKIGKHLSALNSAPEAMIPLILLARENHEDLSKACISTNLGEMPLLFFAIEQRSKELVEALLSADISCESYFEGQSPRLFAHRLITLSSKSHRALHEEILKLIESHLIARGKTLGDENTALHEAVIRGDLDACKKLLEKRQEILPVNMQGYTPLHLAVLLHRTEIISFLLDEQQKGKFKLASPKKKTLSIKGQGPVKNRVFFTRNTSEGGNLLALALAEGDFAIANQLWEKELSTGKTEFDEKALREMVFETLYFIAQNKSEDVFKNAYAWLKSKTTLEEEPLIAAIIAKNVSLANWLISQDRKMFSKAAEEALGLIIDKQNLPMLQFFMQQDEFSSTIQINDVIGFVIQHDDPILFEKLVETSRYDLGLILGPQLEHIIAAPEHKVLKAMIGNRSGLSIDEVHHVLGIMEKLFGSDLKSFPPSLLFHLMQHAKSLNDWETHLQLTKKIYDNYSPELKSLIEPNQFFKEIFEEIFDKFQKHLAKEDQIVERLFALLQKVDSKSQLALYFNALQRGSALEDLSIALDIAKEKEIHGVPSFKQFESLTKAEKKQWMTYFAVSGFRGGYDLCWQVVKLETDPELLCSALNGMEKIGVSIPLKKIQNILSILFEHDHEAVRLQAIKTLAAVRFDSKCEYSKKAILSQFKYQNSKQTHLALIQLLGNYDFRADTSINRHCLDFVLQSSNHKGRDIRIQSAFTLSRMHNEKALIRAAEIVKSSDWNFMDEFFGEDRKFFSGDWWMFVYRPEFHDSRSAILNRIRDQLAELHQRVIGDQVDQRLKAFEKNPDSFLELSQLVTRFRNLPRSCRYIPIPIYFPTTPGSYLLRGLKARKGDELFYESVRDLIRKGCGKSDLTRFDEQFTAGSWSKVGQMFATHSIKGAHQYFAERQGCLILFDPAYYHSQYQKGMARLENEGSINTSLYQGIPKNAIKLIYLSKEFENDMHMLNGDKPIDEKFLKKLNSDAFCHCSITELNQYRAYLHEKMEPLTDQNGPIQIHNQMFYKTFFDCFRFIEPGSDQISERLSLDGVKEIPIEAVERETVRMAIARQIVAEEFTPTLGNDFFLTPDEILAQFSDEEFKDKLPQLFSALGLDENAFQETLKDFISIYDYTLDAIAGLSTDLSLKTLTSEKTRKALRLAVLYHGVGHLPQESEVQSRLVERSAELAKKEMLKNLKIQGISSVEAELICQMIFSHRLFGHYLKGTLSLEQLEGQLDTAYQNVPQGMGLSKEDLTKMLWAISVALASEEQKQAYQSLLDSKTLDHTSLNCLKTLGHQASTRITQLWEDSDADFKKQLAILIRNKELPYDFAAFSNYLAGHGHTSSGRPFTLLEHTLEVICGSQEAFGLNTTVTISDLNPAQARKILRIAALFHDSGKIKGRKGHIERSAEMAVEALTENAQKWGVTQDEITLIHQIILSNDFYGLYLQKHAKITFEELQMKCSESYSKLNLKDLSITEAEFKKLMFAFWIADASTLGIVNRIHSNLYRPLSQHVDTLDFDKLTEILQVKQHLIASDVQQKHPTRRAQDLYAITSTQKRSTQVQGLLHWHELNPQLSRGEQPSSANLKELQEKGIRTVISFRRKKEDSAQHQGIHQIYIPIKLSNPVTIDEETILGFLREVTNRENYPIFMHCLYGADRTGFMSAVYRYVVEGASLEDAIAELTRFSSHDSYKWHPGLIKRLEELDVQSLRKQFLKTT